ncbi:MAG: hypothetical protein EAZ53_07170 [Bacteroidetes bacterium]|nr:MAG: hypothetical protein EAZ53_07170 [Bacteroidota bacterium]
MKSYFNVVFAFSVLLFISCCTKKEDTTKPEETNISKLFVENQYDNIIIPAFADLKSNTDVLAIRINNFANNPTQSSLDSAQIAYENAAIAFQYVAPLNFGPSEDGITGLKENVNTFPVNTTDIETFITNNNFSLNDFRRECRGLGAIDYLLHTITGSDAAVLAKYGAGSDNRKNYLKAVANKIKSQVDAANDKWVAYRTTFTSDLSTNASSSITKLFNAMLIAHEDIKNYKLALPLGLRAGQTSTQPTQVEAYYSGISMKLIEHNIKAVENVWQCKSKSGTKGKGFDEKLLVINKKDLIANIQNQFNAIYSAYQKVETGRFSDLIANNATNSTALLSNVSALTRFIKSDLSSALGLTISYTSNDGD